MILKHSKLSMSPKISHRPVVWGRHSQVKRHPANGNRCNTSAVSTRATRSKHRSLFTRMPQSVAGTPTNLVKKWIRQLHIELCIACLSHSQPIEASNMTAELEQEPKDIKLARPMALTNTCLTYGSTSCPLSQPSS